MSLPTQPLCCFRHYWPWHLDHPSLILVWYPWLCSQLVQVISVISLLPCQMWNWPVFLAHTLLRCSPKTLYLVHYSLSCTPLLSVPSVNHELIFPILHHPVIWVAFPPSVPSTHHFRHRLPLHSFTPGLELSFSANPSHHSLPFLLPDWFHGFPRLFTKTSEHICFYILVFLFSTVSCCSVLKINQRLM